MTWFWLWWLVLNINLGKYDLILAFAVVVVGVNFITGKHDLILGGCGGWCTRGLGSVPMSASIFLDFFLIFEGISSWYALYFFLRYDLILAWAVVVVGVHEGWAVSLCLPVMFVFLSDFLGGFLSDMLYISFWDMTWFWLWRLWWLVYTRAGQCPHVCQ